MFYKLTGYLADFKTLKNQSRMDILFLMVFFVTLFLPMSHIDIDSKKNNIENRALAKYKPFLKKNKEINFDFGKNYDSWFSDRFNMREIIIRMYTHFRYNIAYIYYERPSKAFINKKTNWCFMINNYHLTLFTPLKQDNIRLAVKNLERFDRFCTEQNIKLYVLVVPSKEAIYNQYATPYNFDKETNFKKLEAYIKENTNLRFIYPYTQLKDASNSEFVFFKTDHHWTEYGAWIGYQELVKEIKKDFPDYIPQSINNFNIEKQKMVRSDFTRIYTTGQTLYTFLNLDDKKIAEKVLDTQYKYFEHKDQLNLKVDVNKKLMKKLYKYKNAQNNLNAYLLGNSACENFTQILPYDFKSLKRVRTNNKRVKFNDEMRISRFSQEIKEYKPDIVIICITDTYITPILNMYSEEKN